MSRRKQAKPRACLKRKWSESGQSVVNGRWSLVTGHWPVVRDALSPGATNWHGLHFHECSVWAWVCVCASDWFALINPQKGGGATTLLCQTLLAGPQNVTNANGLGLRRPSLAHRPVGYLYCHCSSSYIGPSGALGPGLGLGLALGLGPGLGPGSHSQSHSSDRAAAQQLAGIGQSQGISTPNCQW